MLEKINSKYILKHIFQFLNKKYFLKIINYNKSLQERCSIDTLEYKKYAIVYVLKDKDGNYILKSPKNNFIFYKGGYSKKAKNGFGEEYKYIDIKLTEFQKQDKKYFKDLNINISEEIKKSKNYENFTFTEETKNGIVKKMENIIFFILL